jgi:hypothetical protein
MVISTHACAHKIVPDSTDDDVRLFQNLSTSVKFEEKSRVNVGVGVLRPRHDLFKVKRKCARKPNERWKLRVN